MKPDIKKRQENNEKLNQLNSVKVTSRVQRASGDRIENTLMLEGYVVPFTSLPALCHVAEEPGLVDG